jgi:hypothetical protein
MRKIVTYLIILGVVQLFPRQFLFDPGYLKEVPDSLNYSKVNNLDYMVQNRTHRAGLLKMNMTNYGAITPMQPSYFNVSAANFTDECSGKRSFGAEMPSGSGIDYLLFAGLWLGGYLEINELNINQNQATVFQGPLVSTAFDDYYAFSCELAPVKFDDDPSGMTLGLYKESSNVEGKMNCLFEDVYDPKATAYEQLHVMYSDKSTDQYTYDGIDGRSHIPLGVEIRQKSYAWPYDYACKFVIVDYTFYNRNAEKKDIYDFFIGLLSISDAFNSDDNGNLYYGFHDDITGFIENWNGYIDPATGEQKTVDMNMVWSADNDGRNIDPLTMSEPSGGHPLEGATGVFSVRVLRNPNPDLKYSFNIWTTEWFDEISDWGPHWKTGLHSDWEFDLTVGQKGYDDSNYDEMLSFGNDSLQGGRVEGTPMGDIGRYMVMSNGEFDYNHTSIREVYLIMDHQADGTPIPQAEKWQPWVVTGTEHEGELPDGEIRKLNEIANGKLSDCLLGFGPLGNESYVNVAVDTDGDSLGMPDDYINKKVWKFAYGDSLKLTLAFMVSENFHTSLDQNPNYTDSTVVDLDDGLDISLYDQGWYDAFNNVVWAERVFDTPMFDTPETRWGATKKDGWFGEDVGKDAMFGEVVSDPLCWWLDAAYPGPDEGEGDFEMTTFTSPITDCYGDEAATEDMLLPFGRKEWSDDYGPTGNSTDGEGYGYMVKYDKLAGVYPQGTWVRYGFDNDRLDAGDGVPDFTSPPPPPPPKITVTEIDNEVIVEWCSHEFYTGDDGTVGVAGPEFTFDPYTRLYDFEGYSIELSPDRQLSNFSTIYSVDKVNYSYQNVSNLYEYLDNPIPADTLAAYPENFPASVVSNGKIYRLVPFGDNCDLTQDYELEGMFSYSCEIDSSQVAEFGYIRNYKFVLHDQTLAQKKYIAVTAKDFGAPKMGVPAIKSSPESNATATVTANLTTTKDVVVVPNPYRGDVDYRDMGWEDNDGQYVYAEEYRKIAFLNIPERCVIRIYTLAGDMCKVITHNGYSDSDTPYWYGKNGAYWNLINENHQAVMSGIYLFSVQDVDKKKDDFVGKFVIIK